jgi:hypothetical protein
VTAVGERARVDGHLLERIGDRLRARAESSFSGSHGIWKKKMYQDLRSWRNAAELASHACRMGHVHDHQPRSGRTSADGEHPRLRRTPVVTDQRDVVASRRVDQRGDVGEQRSIE